MALPWAAGASPRLIPGGATVEIEVVPFDEASRGSRSMFSFASLFGGGGSSSSRGGSSSTGATFERLEIGPSQK